MTNSDEREPTSNAASPGGDDASTPATGSDPNDSQKSSNQQAEHKEPPLAPACMVVGILTLAVFCSVCGFGSWFVFRDQYPFAVKGIEQQLIPWVESSQLAPADKDSIASDLRDLVPKLEDRAIDKQQLLRLHNCLQDNPVLLWGCIQSILAQAPGTELTPTEQQAVIRLSQRLLRAAAERKIGRNDVEFTLHNCADVRQDQQSLEVPNDLTAEQIRQYMERAEQLVEQHEIPNEPYDKTPAEAFQILVDSALTID